jgi:cytochrome P450
MLEEIRTIESARVVHLDGERHRRVRSAAQRAFTPKRVAELATAVQRIVDEQLEHCASYEDSDMVDFAYHIPLLVVMDIIGAPYEDAELIRGWGSAINRTQAGSPARPEDVRAAHQALLAFRLYVEALVERQRTESSDERTTLVSALFDASSADQLTEEELIGFYLILLSTGHESTTALIANSIRALFVERAQWRLLCADPSLAASAAEEVIRYDSPSQFFPKRVAHDTEIAGVPVAAGTQILCGNGAANRDSAACEKPDVFDIRRGPSDHLSLGFGVHFCLGASIARLEGRIALETLARRCPDLELCVDPSSVTYEPNASKRGVKSLPARIGPLRVAHR